MYGILIRQGTELKERWNPYAILTLSDHRAVFGGRIADRIIPLVSGFLLIGIIVTTVVIVVGAGFKFYELIVKYSLTHAFK